VASKYLDNAKVQPLGSDFSEQFPSNAQIIIMLGDDYVTAHGTG